ncbi:lipopolysaccharide biosynthesis protein [Lapidilactobacillus luobeiensis]|uniref:lipopolysaccharide biosynthesis protein n=1 Tax=Lapidilactobacillus luobeiensis TaxID=2950371 RepID=UPI0021C43582|nr:oligosaccharide flippase family protein [Lapidilactobacillus luobeiensis]
MEKIKIKKYIIKYNSLPTPIKASFWFLICAFLQRGISVITTPIFTRLLTTAEYGEYNVFNSWMGIVSVFVTVNLFSGVFTQGLVKFEDKKNQFASSLQGLCLTLCVVWTVIYLLFHNFWNQLFTLTTVQMLAMLCMIWATAVFNFWSVYERVDFKYKRLVIVSVAVSLSKPVLGVIFVLLAKDKVTARILGLALVELIAYTWMFISQIRRGKRFFDKKFWLYALAFNLPLIPHYLSMTVLNSSDRIMINSMVGPDAAGIYSLAYSVSQIMTIFNISLMQTIEPWLYKKIKSRRIGDMALIAYPTFGLIAAVNIILIALAPEIVSIFAPASYYDAIWVIPPVAMSVYFTFAYTFFAVFEFYYEKTKYIAAATTFGAILNIVLNYIFIPIFGYYAAGYTTLVCFIIFAIYHFYFMKKICKTEFDGASPYSTKILLIITGIFMLLGFSLLLTYRNVILRYGIILILCVALFVKRKELIKQVKRIISIKKS